MTVTYSSRMSNTRMVTMFGLLIRWKGSIYKLLYREMLIYWLLYATLSVLYRFAFNEHIKNKFEHLCIFLGQYTNIVPLTFILGFYVNMVVNRWWNIYQTIAWPDRTVHKIAAYITGFDDGSRLIRRTLARWLNLSNVLMLRDTSSAARKRFPTMEHVRDAGFITQEEMKEFERFPLPSHGYWVPLRWCHELTVRSRAEGRIGNDRFLVKLIDEYGDYRGTVSELLSYDWISVPLVYTQVVAIAVYSFFLASLFSRQYLRPEKGYASHEADLYFPFFTTMQFIFYMGWLKVAETLINPLGEDDDDFEINWIIDRNIKTSYLIADEMYGRIPLLERDKYWDDKDIAIPYTLASLGVKSQAPVESQSEVKVGEEAAQVVSHAASVASSMNSVGVVAPITRKTSIKDRLLGKSVSTISAHSQPANQQQIQDLPVHNLVTIDELDDENTIPLIDATPKSANSNEQNNFEFEH